MERVTRRGLPRVVMVVVLVGLAALGVGATTPAGASPVVLPPMVSLADPFVVTTTGGYVAFGTNAKVGSVERNVPVMISSDLVTWVALGDALPDLPAWAVPGGTWSPSVHVAGSIDVLYFTAKDRQTGRECIGAATASRITGPYHPTATPLVCQIQLGGDIDPQVFTATDGTSWLLWKNDGNCCDQPVALWSQQLSSFGQLAGSPTQLLSAQEPWEHGVIENPSVVEHAGLFVLTYSAGSWNSSDYATGSAICVQLDRPCVRISTGGPTWPAVAGTAGDGGASFFVDRGGVQRVAFHAWTAGRVGSARGSRQLWSAAVGWFGDIPVLTGLPQPALTPTPTTAVTTTATTAVTTTAPSTTAPAALAPTLVPRPVAGLPIGPVATAVPVAMTPVRSDRTPRSSGLAGLMLIVVVGAGLFTFGARRRRLTVAATTVGGTTAP